MAVIDSNSSSGKVFFASRFAVLGLAIALGACAHKPSQEDSAQVARGQAPQPHQTPETANPDALPKGLIEWVNYVCSIPDPEARKQAMKDAEEQKGWTFTCPEEKPPGNP